MKIIQVVPAFVFGGAETMCENLINALVKQGNEVSAISMYTKKTAITERLEAKGIKIYYLDKKSGLDLSMIGKMRRIFKDEKPDVVHSHLNALQYTVPAAMMAKIKRRIHTVHSMAFREQVGIAKKAAKFFYKRCKVTPVALSEIVKESVVELYKLPPEKVPFVFNGVDFSNCIVKDNYVMKSEFKILHIGRFTEVKNHQLLVSAFEKFVKARANSKLILIGDGELRSSIESMVKEKGISEKVEFLGIQSNVYSFLNESDMFILTSKYEGIPLTLVEAMGTGLPVISTKVGGVPDMIEDGVSGLLVDVDENSIVKALENVYDNKDLREKIGLGALKASVDFSSDIMAKKYLSIYVNN